MMVAEECEHDRGEAAVNDKQVQFYTVQLCSVLTGSLLTVRHNINNPIELIIDHKIRIVIIITQLAL